MVWVYAIVLPLLVLGAAIGASVAWIVWRETFRQLQPGSPLREQYRQNWAVGTRSTARWFTTGGALWALVVGCIGLDAALRPPWYLAVFVGLVGGGWAAIAAVCTVQGVRARRVQITR